ncbi:MAG: HXXEE domain-containing protein [Devosia sp.]
MMQTSTLIWLFPISFMFHDLEEIALWEPWMRRNSDALRRRLPRAFASLVESIAGKSAAELSVSIALIFLVTVIATVLAAHEQYWLFLATTGMYFVHGFGHLAQAAILKRYVPGVITSALIVIPYGAILYWQLVDAGIVDLQGLVLYFLLGAALMVPFILFMHRIGGYIHHRMVELLIR